MALMSLEIEILETVPSGPRRPYAYAVWTDRRGDLQMGPVRDRWVDPDDGTVYYQCSPFPGAWDNHVPQERVHRVRHLQAMSLQGADDVR
ncbi:hypothetical protein ACFOOM_01095 [Streptomyces echinoruber]|uniref:Uncharacterized protein n=1 Tax=Streptomyces echinoruber TaxID=68898 RepID=A0A918V626_9ACTN|nr:hypothetical protein [Streptomyces echinoruber]GGZ73079.1 hypothetical protein GCM10010389_08150 [Streptomyces echinoruber]